MSWFEIGMGDGIGEGEQIYSVRFLDDAAYVVTFHQTDPLYTIDLADPTSPQVVGELKILGYSSYLHPVDDGLLLGIGQDPTDTGQVKGTQVSVFDVGDPGDPRRIDQFTVTEGSSSQVEYDHHAFLYWEQTGLAMVPVQQWSWDGERESVFLGAVGFTVDDGGNLGEIARLVHPGGEDKYGDHRAPIMRSMVIADRLYTVSAKGISFPVSRPTRSRKSEPSSWLIDGTTACIRSARSHIRAAWSGSGFGAPATARYPSPMVLIFSAPHSATRASNREKIRLSSPISCSGGILVE